MEPVKDHYVVRLEVLGPDGARTVTTAIDGADLAWSGSLGQLIDSVVRGVRAQLDLPDVDDDGVNLIHEHLRSMRTAALAELAGLRDAIGRTRYAESYALLLRADEIVELLRGPGRAGG